MVYAGEFRHAVDAKHRVTIPSRWRGKDGEEFFAVPDPAGNFLMILPPEEFDRVKSDVEANASIAPADAANSSAGFTRWRSWSRSTSKDACCCRRTTAGVSVSKAKWC